MVFEKAPNRRAIRLGLLKNHDVVTADRNQQLIAGLQSQRFARLR